MWATDHASARRAIPGHRARLPGIGDSAIPKGDIDMMTAAVRIPRHCEVTGRARARVVGHDIGLMSHMPDAAQFPAEVEKLVVMDAFPRRGRLDSLYDAPGVWHFRFNGPIPEALVSGRERTYFEHFWNGFAADKTRSIPAADRKAYARAYARPDGCVQGGLFRLVPKTAKDFRRARPAQADDARPRHRRANANASLPSPGRCGWLPRT
jgi:pimeloyl-ACP methyl ester carboxylesterase